MLFRWDQHEDRVFLQNRFSKLSCSFILDTFFFPSFFFRPFNLILLVISSQEKIQHSTRTHFGLSLTVLRIFNQSQFCIFPWYKHQNLLDSQKEKGLLKYTDLIGHFNILHSSYLSTECNYQIKSCLNWSYRLNFPACIINVMLVSISIHYVRSHPFMKKN